MEAGRGIDLLIEEKVMGISAKPGTIGADFKKLCIRPYGKRYSTDISAAWEVVEKMNAYWHYELFMHSGDGRKEASFIDSRKDKYVKAKAETAPMAICLAALKAVNHDPADRTHADTSQHPEDQE